MPCRASPADASAASKTLPPGISTGITPTDVEDLAMQHFGPFAVGIACFVFLAVATAITLWTALQNL